MSGGGVRVLWFLFTTASATSHGPRIKSLYSLSLLSGYVVRYGPSSSKKPSNLLTLWWWGGRLEIYLFHRHKYKTEVKFYSMYQRLELFCNESETEPILNGLFVNYTMQEETASTVMYAQTRGVQRELWLKSSLAVLLINRMHINLWYRFKLIEIEAQSHFCLSQ